MSIRIAVVSLWAENVSTSAHFYRDVIGLEIVPHHAGDSVYFDLGGSHLAIVHGRLAISPETEPRFPVVAFSIPDLDAAIEKLRLHDVEMPWGVESNADCRGVMFHDPAGNLVELVEFK